MGVAINLQAPGKICGHVVTAVYNEGKIMKMRAPPHSQTYVA